MYSVQFDTVDWMECISRTAAPLIWNTVKAPRIAAASFTLPSRNISRSRVELMMPPLHCLGFLSPANTANLFDWIGFKILKVFWTGTLPCQCGNQLCSESSTACVSSYLDKLQRCDDDRDSSIPWMELRARHKTQAVFTRIWGEASLSK